MCGIFAFTGPAAPDPELLAAAAAGAAQRGPHGHGWAGHGTGAHRALGPLNLAQLRNATGPRLLGHARLATFGDYASVAELQPIRAAGGHLLAHNGNVYNGPAFDPDAATDSLALATAYDAHRRAGTAPAEALAALLARADHTAWAIVILDATGVLLAHRRGLPLWRHTDSTGTYLSSRPFAAARELPADALHAEEAARVASVA